MGEDQLKIFYVLGICKVIKSKESQFNELILQQATEQRKKENKEKTSKQNSETNCSLTGITDLNFLTLPLQ